MNRWKKYLFLSIALLVVALLIIKVKQNNSTDRQVKKVTPFYGNIRVSITTTGIVQPQNRLEVKPSISGRVEEVLVKEGQEISAGQILAWMSSTDRAALLDAARAKSEGELNYWKEVYKATPLIAPIEGKVIVRAVEPGQAVTSADAVIVLSDRLIVKAQADETDIGKIRIGQPALIGLDAYPGTQVKGEVDHIAYESKIVSNVTIYEVDILPERVPKVFRSGMSASVEILERIRDNVLLLPLEAVRYDNQGSFVLRSENSGRDFSKQRIELGIFDQNNIEILSGLKEKDKVLVPQQEMAPSSRTASGHNPFMPSRRGR